MGVDLYEVVPFTRELAALQPEEFIERYLVEPFRMRDLVVGANFALGKNRVGNVARARRDRRRARFRGRGGAVCSSFEGGPVSSTRIRELLAEGRVADAAGSSAAATACAARSSRATASAASSACRRRTSACHEEKFLPADGIYAAWAGSRRSRVAAGALSLGCGRRSANRPARLELHLLDWGGELVGREPGGRIRGRIRGQVKFDHPDALAAPCRTTCARSAPASRPRALPPDTARDNLAHWAISSPRRLPQPRVRC